MDPMILYLFRTQLA